MAVDHALGMTGGAACVAHASGRPLVDFGPGESWFLGRKELLVPQHVAQRRRVAFADDHKVAHGLQARSDAGEDRHHRIFHQDDRVLGVVDDILELLGEKPQVEGVEDSAHQRHCEVCFEMLLGVPRQRPDAIIGSHAEAPQRSRQLFRPIGDRRVRCLAARHPLASHHLAASIDRAAMPEDGGDVYRKILHGALHPDFLLSLDRPSYSRSLVVTKRLIAASTSFGRSRCGEWPQPVSSTSSTSPPSCRWTASTCLMVPNSSFSPWTTRVGIRMCGRYLSRFQERKPGSSQARFHPQKAPSTFLPWYLASFWGRSVVRKAWPALSILCSPASSAKTCGASRMSPSRPGPGSLPA